MKATILHKHLLLFYITHLLQTWKVPFFITASKLIAMRRGTIVPFTRVAVEVESGEMFDQREKQHFITAIKEAGLCSSTRWQYFTVM